MSERAIRFFAWGLAVFLLLEALANFVRKVFGLGMTDHRELCGPVSFVLGVLALVVARSGNAWPRFWTRRPAHRGRAKAQSAASPRSSLTRQQRT